MAKTFDSQTGHFLSVVLRSMPRGMSADVMQEWAENPKALHRALQNALCPTKIWSTLKLGTRLVTATDFCKAINNTGMKIDSWAIRMLGGPEFTVATQPCEVNLVVKSVVDLGFQDRARYDQVCAEAIEQGLKLCPAEVGPQLRLQYSEQKCREVLIIAMEGVRNSTGGLDIFTVGHTVCGRWLDSSCGAPDFLLDPKDKLVFMVD